MKKIISMLLLSISIITAVSACSPAADKQKSQQPAQQTATTQKTTQPLSVGILQDVDSIPLIIARQQGFFEKEGVTVKLESFKSAPDRDSALQAGKIDGTISDMLAVAFAKEGGFDVKITSKTDGSYKMLASKSASADSISAMKGKSVAISKNTIIEYATDRMVKEGGLSSSDIKKEIIAQMPARLEMLQNGKVDGATLPEPLASVAISNGAKFINSSDKLGINPGILLFTTKSINTKSNEIKAFYKAYNLAVEYLKKEPLANYIDVLIKDGGFPEAVKGNLVLPPYTKAQAPDEKNFDSVIQWLKGKELIKGTYKLNDVMDVQFVR
ncbi:MAG: transporter substrate-binding protein [Clostridiales bacterium]|jgi:NitT/TauT family transport system substrate-binding protein|nr:transporter substrate-binding protein [Clostridiales bacterium]